MKRSLLSFSGSDQLLDPINRDLIAYPVQNSLVPLKCFVNLNALVTQSLALPPGKGKRTFQCVPLFDQTKTTCFIDDVLRGYFVSLRVPPYGHALPG